MKNLIPVGNKILVKKIKSDNISGGIQWHAKGEKFGNVWFIIIALPEHQENPYINCLKVGGKVMCKEFDYDKGVNPDHDDDFAVVDVEPKDGSRAGQVLCYIPPEK